MVGISEYSFCLGSNVRTVEEIARADPEAGIEKMREIGLEKVPTDNGRLLQSMIAEAVSGTSKKPDVIYIAHSLPFIRATASVCHAASDSDQESDAFVNLGHKWDRVSELCHERDFVSEPVQRKNTASVLRQGWNAASVFGGCQEEIPVYYMSGTPCAIMHVAVNMACRMIEDGIYERILIVGADKAYSDRERMFFGTIMGDGVVALLLEKGSRNNHILACFDQTLVIAPYGENTEEDRIADFRQVNVSMMRSAMEKCREKAGISKVDYYVTHTSNRTFWDAVSQLSKIDRSRFLDGNIKHTGHMNSHDSFYHYFYWIKQGVIREGQTVMLINPGFGGTQGCTLICR